MKLSIITINYNNRLGLQKSIDSVVMQTCKDFEWIVIDGGSTDGSRELIEHHKGDISYWCSEADGGIYNAMNKGIAQAKGEYCLCLNSGDWLCSRDVLSVVIPYLNGDDFIVGNVYMSSDPTKSMVKESHFSDSGVIWVLNQFAYPHQGTFIKRSVFEKYGLYREDLKISSDWWLSYNAIILGKATIKYIPCDISIYDTNGISSTNSSLMIEEREKILKERPYLYQMHLFYNQNIDIIRAIKCNRWVYAIFRIYFKLYRVFAA